MRSQIALEFLVILAIFLVGALIFVGLASDQFNFFTNEADRDNMRFWARQQVGILQVDVGSSSTNVVLLNNHRENITIDAIELNERDLNITPGNIGPNEARNFSVTKTNFYREVSVSINYTIGSQQVNFTGNNINYKGVEN